MRHCLRIIVLLSGFFFAGPAESVAQTNARLGLLEALPPHLEFRPGELSFVVDYAANPGEVIAPLYVVNAGTEPVQHRVYSVILRETLGDDGLWRRSDPYVPPSCGTGLTETITIPAGGFFKTAVRRDSTSGDRRKVRFRNYPPEAEPAPISNEGEGLVHPNDTRLSRLDYLAAANGSFEELAHVATEEAAVLLHFENGIRGFAISRLASLVDEPRRVPTLKEVVRKARSQGDAAAYESALRGLSVVSPPQWTREQFWAFAMQEFSSSEGAFASGAYAALLDARFFPNKKRAWLDQILANPRHPLIHGALKDYPDIAGKPAATALVKRIVSSARYREDFKRHALALQDQWLVNKLVVVEATIAEPDALGGRALAITLSNVSGEPIALRIADPQDLVTITATDGDHRKIPGRKRATAKAIPEKRVELKPLADFHFPPLPWWRFVDLSKVPENQLVRLTVRVQTPGLNEYPAIAPSEVEIPPSAVNAARDRQRLSVAN